MNDRRTVLGWLDAEQRATQSADPHLIRVTESRGEDEGPITKTRGEDGVYMSGPDTRNRGDDDQGAPIETRSRGDEPETFVRGEGPETAVRGDE